MTWITVPHACGHTHWQDIHGMELHRRRVLAAAQSTPCPSCRASLARSVAEQEGLPPLQGSDRQIAWAHPIRTEAMAQAGALSCEMDRAEKTLQDPARWPRGLTADEAARRLAALREKRAALQRLWREARASWWIDHRGQGLKLLVHQVATASDTAAQLPRPPRVVDIHLRGQPHAA